MLAFNVGSPNLQNVEILRLISYLQTPEENAAC